MDEVKMSDAAVDTGPLEPFLHQVGGHSEFQQFGKHTVCKPFNSKEHEFYREMPSALKPFIPQFKGVATVESADACEGSPRLIVHPNKEMFPNMPNELHDSDGDMVGNSWEWKDMECLQATISTGESTTRKPKPRQYLMLENIISRYIQPCILDLKMGRQSHSDYKISEEEIVERRKKWEKTTARTLGVRIVGMKIYRAGYGDVLSRTKKDGDILTEQGFEENLALFFYNGKTNRCDVIDCFIKKLERFLETMEKLMSPYRFYNSSLLFVYEGDAVKTYPERSTDCKRYCDDKSDCEYTCPCLDQMDFRMIDFAHVSRHECNDDSNNSQCSVGPDQEYIFGLKSLIRILQKILARGPILK